MATSSSFCLCGGSGDMLRRMEFTRKCRAWCVDIRVWLSKVVIIFD